MVGWIPHQQPHNHIPQWFTIWWFPKIGGTPLWMFYNGKSFQSGWFRGTPHFRKTDTGGITVWRRKEARSWASKPHGRAPASLKQYPGFQVKRCYKMDIHFDHPWPLVATNIWSTVLYPWSCGCKHPSVRSLSWGNHWLNAWLSWLLPFKQMPISGINWVSLLQTKQRHLGGVSAARGWATHPQDMKVI